MKLTLIRHAECIDNARDAHAAFDSPLTEKGKQQATQVKFTESFDAVYTSPMTRAKDTAKILFNEPIIEDARLQEKTDGIYDGKVKSEVDWSEINKQPFLERKAPQGESLNEVITRVQSFLNDLKEGSYAIVSHATTIRIIRALILNHDIEDEIRNTHLKNCEIITLEY